MDHTLSREESKRLMSLLGLSMDQWGNFPIMRKAFLTKCKILHPDKGGDQELAKELISLYKRAQESAAALNPDTQFSTTQVCQSGTCVLIQNVEDCFNRKELCSCIFCLLRDAHETKEKRPKVWGRCYCYECFKVWFGLEESGTVFINWQFVIGAIPFSALNI
ncbi:putative small T antigen [Myotis polyomavirus VM-2008]|uniref:Small t antigen n=1 Tax=Myotis polyomavirus VM-2008 TaxID=563775 RepID=B6E003_9POLY|nr:putative small T antigen [Myotis polyomavirus VM-2008]ACI16489.1 putative small T antigen [Myotis polyomavirus VM-2008]